ncbi:MAG: glycoside hydrolase family 13 protein [Desulfurococcaceae archaeon]
MPALMRKCILVLFVLTIAFSTMIFSSSQSSEFAIYLDETVDFTHDPLDPVYLSIADGNVVFRIKVKSNLNLESVYLIVGNTEILMKPQLYLINSTIWYGAIHYTGVNFTYYFKAILRNRTVIWVYSDRTNKEFYFDGVDRYPQIYWVRSRVGYEIFPDRFYNGNPGNDYYALIYDNLLYNNVTKGTPILSNWTDPPYLPHHCCNQYFGGDIHGIIMKLDYLKELGVGLIYLTPVFLCGSTHCYDTYDYYQIHPRLGTLEDLHILLEEADKRGIKVIFDFVPDHVGLGFWAFQDVYINGPSSRYWHWFTIYKWPLTPGNASHYRCWWNIGSMPQLNTTNPEVKEYLINVVLHWLELGFSGVRIDTPLDLLNSLEFFKELREAIKLKFPKAYIIGEIWEQRPEWVNKGPFDSLMNYALGSILVNYVNGKISDASLRLSEYYANYSVAIAGMGFNIISSHDTDRALTMVGGGRLFPKPNPSKESVERLKLLSTLQYTQPGIPVVFQGDERGIPGVRTHPWEEHRYPIQWDQLNEEVFEHYKKLGWLKNHLKPLHSSIIKILNASGAILAYTRGYNDEVMVIANNWLEPAVFELPQDLATVEWLILYTSSGREPVITDREVVVPPLTAIVLLNKEYEQSAFTEMPATEIPTTSPTSTPISTPTSPTETPITPPPTSTLIPTTFTQIETEVADITGRWLLLAATLIIVVLSALIAFTAMKKK